MCLAGYSRPARPRAWIALITAVVLSACTSVRTVPIEPGRAPEGVAPGDKVMATTVDGEKLEFDVVRIDADALVGKDARVPFEDIAALEVEEADTARTIGGSVVAGVAAFLAVLLLLGAMIITPG